MISPEAARQFAESNFPEAPERLAQHLAIDVRYSTMSGCDGYCLVLRDKAIVRINSQLSPYRKRFTLAHELGHIILGIPGVVGESFEQMIGSKETEERRVNQLASEILMPIQVVKQIIPDVPVVSGALKRLAKRSNVSELAAAIRVCNLAESIGLINASVVFFGDGDSVTWQWSTTLQMPEETARLLLQEAGGIAPEVYRLPRDDGNTIVASILANPAFGSATLFVQLLPTSLGMQPSHHEKRRRLETELFANNAKLQQQMSGLFGAHKGKIDGLSMSQAINLFWERNRTKVANTTVDSAIGREYVELRIGEWY